MAKRKRKAIKQGDAAKRAKLNVTRKSSTEHPAQPKKASLLGIPAELRNQILEEVLVLYEGDEPIFVDAAFKQPGILRTSRQLRDEGLPMFIGRNLWGVFIQDLKLEPHVGHWLFKYESVQSLLYFRGHESKSNFREWLRMFFEDQKISRIEEPCASELSYEGMMSQPFIIVETLVRNDLPWTAVEEVIGAYMDGVQFASSTPGGMIWDA